MKVQWEVYSQMVNIGTIYVWVKKIINMDNLSYLL